MQASATSGVERSAKIVTLRLYDYPASCNCYKVRLLLANLGRPYERVPIDIFAGDTLTEEYGRINPARTTPVLETDDGRYLPESAAILVYLARGTPYLPDDPFELHVHNQGSGPLALTLTGAAPGGGLVFDIQSLNLTLAPGERRAIHGYVRPAQRQIVGAADLLGAGPGSGVRQSWIPLRRRLLLPNAS